MIKRQVTDDWTKNWDASIAVKISAVVLWLLVIVSIISISFVLSTLKDDLLKLHKSDADQLSYHIGIITSQSNHSKNDLESKFNKLIEKYNFIAFDVKFDDIQYKIGDLSSQKEQHEIREISFNTKAEKYESSGGFGKAIITTYSKPIIEILKDKRRNLIALAFLFLLSFSLTLTWIIGRIVTKPINYLVETTQYISKGNIDARLNLGRHDEFGQLAGFFNSMLDTIETKQVELQHAVKEANAASIAKSDFLANMSHEIRTPLTAITGFSKTLLDKNIDPELRKKAIDSILRNGDHLLTVINDVLDISKIEANKLDISKQPLSIFKLMSDIELLLNSQIVGKGLQFNLQYDFPLPDIIISDEIRLKQILINLCSNAIKFTSKGNVLICISFNQKENILKFEVKDTGIGLTKDQLSKIFAPFTQADTSTTRKYGGTGLGLSISHKLAGLLGGSLSVISKKDQGSCFTLTIDSGIISENDLMYSIPAQEKSDAFQSDVITKSVSGRILLVEDTPDNQLLISYYLAEMGADVTIADNGQIALDILNDNSFDLILMDMQMPVMGGVEAMKILRSQGYKSPIAMLTANAMKQFEEECTKAGCDDYLVKPIEINALQKIVNKYLKKRNKETIDKKTETTFENKPDDTNAITTTLDISNPKLRSLLMRFIDNLDSYLVAIEHDLLFEDYPAISQTAHNLKGASGSFGFSALAEVANLIEEYSNKKQIDNIKNELENLHDIVKRIFIGNR